jgi:hypothetical protein
MTIYGSPISVGNLGPFPAALMAGNFSQQIAVCHHGEECSF